MAEDIVPQFKFDPELLDKIRQDLGVPEDEIPPDNVIALPEQPPVKRKRGRPRKHPVSETGTTVPELAKAEGIDLPPAKLTKRDEREVSERIANILIGGSGLVAVLKPYMLMTEEEAKGISEPLSSYLVRNADTLPVAQQVLENYDLLAITLGILAYVVRVYREYSDERATVRTTKPTTLERIEQHQESVNPGQTEGNTNFVSTPYGIQ